MSIRTASALTLFVACAPAQIQQTPPKAAAPVTAAQIAKTEAVAFAGEREINHAERELEELRPDQALVHLEAAGRALDDAKIDEYPDAKQLKERHSALTARVPRVREEIRRRELAASVAEAEGKIDEARARAKDALAQLARKAADDNDVKLADESLVLLKSAIDASRSLDERDAAFSKYALGAMKELASNKTAIEQRKLELAVEQDRAAIARVLDELGAAIERIAVRDVADEEIDRARSAADDVQKALAQVGPRAAKDPRLAQYVTEVKDRLAAQRTSIDARRQEVTVLRQRALLEDGRRVLAAAMRPLARRDVAEAELAAAEAAVKSLSETVEKGAGLKDRAYGSFASDVTKRAQESSARIATRRIEVAIARHKAEISAARAALGAAVAKIAEQSPEQGSFVAARDAVVSVEKALDGTKSVNDRDLEKYVQDAWKALAPVRGQIDQRRLDVEIAQQRARVEEAVAALDASLGGMTGDHEITAAEGFIASLEKVIEEGGKYGAKNADYSKLSLAALKSASAARKQIRDRREDLVMQAQKDQVEHELATVRGALDVVEGDGVKVEGFTAASEAIARAKRVLDDGAKLEEKLPRYALYAIGALKSLAVSEGRIAERKREIAARDRKVVVENAIADATSRVVAAKSPEATGAELKEATATLRAAREELVKGAGLEKRNAAYEIFATASRKQLDSAQVELDTAKQRVAFREGPLAALTAATSMLESAAQKTPAEQKQALTTALESFRSCQRNATTILADEPKIASALFDLGRFKAKGSTVLTTCTQYIKSTEAKLSKTTPSS